MHQCSSHLFVITGAMESAVAHRMEDNSSQKLIHSELQDSDAKTSAENQSSATASVPTTQEVCYFMFLFMSSPQGDMKHVYLILLI